MRIQSDKDIRDIQKKKLSGTKKSSGGLFSGSLQKKMEEKFDASLKELIDEINLIGKDLLRTKNSKYMKNYKKKVREFLKILSGKYENKIVVSIDEKQGKEKVYNIMEKIDERLEDLTEETLNSVKEHLKLTKSISDIRGLMVDTFG